MARLDGWQVVKQQIVFEHPWLRMIVETIERDGEQRPYFYLESPVDAVAVVAVTQDGQLVLGREYRHPLRQIIDNLPGGRVDVGEDPLKAAHRELVEETGYHAAHVELLGRVSPFPGSLKVTLHLYFASGLQPGPARPDPGEELEIHLRPVEQVYREVLAGEHLDAALHIGLLLARAKGLI